MNAITAYWCGFWWVFVYLWDAVQVDMGAADGDDAGGMAT